MPRYAAFLRGVSPMNAKMPELKQAFESAGFTDVKTILASGNVAFNARATSEPSLQRNAEGAMLERLGQAFLTIVRPMDMLGEMLASDPYRAFRLENRPRSSPKGLHGAAREDVRQRRDDPHVGDCREGHARVRRASILRSGTSHSSATAT